MEVVLTEAVGGEQLDMALGRANTFARFVMCGGISLYNAESKSAPLVRSNFTVFCSVFGQVD